MSRVTTSIRGPTQETALVEANAVDKQKEDLEKMKVNGSGRWKLGQGRNS